MRGCLQFCRPKYVESCAVAHMGLTYCRNAVDVLVNLPLSQSD
jgi:hypothetical protein